MKKLVALSIYLAISLLTAAGMNASFRAEFRHITSDARQSRQNFTVSLLFGLLPPEWIVVPFMTGFYQDGFSLEWRPKP